MPSAMFFSVSISMWKRTSALRPRSSSPPCINALKRFHMVVPTLPAQCGHRIDAGGAQGRNGTRAARHQCQQARRRRSSNHRIEGRYFEQQTLDKSCRGRLPPINPAPRPAAIGVEVLPQHPRNDLATAGAKSHSHANLRRSLGDERRHHAVDADRGQHHGDEGEDAEQHEQQPLLGQGLIGELLRAWSGRSAAALNRSTIRRRRAEPSNAAASRSGAHHHLHRRPRPLQDRPVELHFRRRRQGLRPHIVDDTDHFHDLPAALRAHDDAAADQRRDRRQVSDRWRARRSRRAARRRCRGR